MNYPIHIRFSGMDPSIALTTAAEVHAYGLAWAESEIIACWVGICFDPQHDGPGGPYSVRVDVKIPGHDLIAKRVQHDDVHLAMGHAMQDMKDQLRAIDPREYASEYAVTINGQLMTPDSLSRSQFGYGRV
ncbi:MAG: hypothetical protein V4858_27650 [Pseudomonadota bacterium]